MTQLINYCRSVSKIAKASIITIMASHIVVVLIAGDLLAHQPKHVILARVLAACSQVGIRSNHREISLALWTSQISKTQLQILQIYTTVMCQHQFFTHRLCLEVIKDTGNSDRVSAHAKRPLV